MPDTPQLPAFVNWPSFPFEGQLRTKRLDAPVPVEPLREGDDPNTCIACKTPDDDYIWVSDRWRVRATEQPSGLPMVLILESRSHLDLGDLPNLHAAELGVMTVRIERAIRSIDGVERVHVNRWGDGAAHFHLWFLARPTGYLQLRGSFLSQWDDILEPISEASWRENLAHVAAWLADFGGRAVAEPPRIEWHTPSRFADTVLVEEDPIDDRSDRDGRNGAAAAEHVALQSDDAPVQAAASPAIPRQLIPQQSAPQQSVASSSTSPESTSASSTSASSTSPQGAPLLSPLPQNASVGAAAPEGTAPQQSHASQTNEPQTSGSQGGGSQGTVPPPPAGQSTLTVQPAVTVRGTASVPSQIPEQSRGESDPDWSISEEELASSDILAR